MFLFCHLLLKLIHSMLAIKVYLHLIANQSELVDVIYAELLLGEPSPVGQGRGSGPVSSWVLQGGGSWGLIPFFSPELAFSTKCLCQEGLRQKWSSKSAPGKVAKKEVSGNRAAAQRENCGLEALASSTAVWLDWFSRQDDRWLCQGSQGVP